MTTATFTAAAPLPRLFDAAGALATLRRWLAQQHRTVQAAAQGVARTRAEAQDQDRAEDRAEARAEARAEGQAPRRWSATATDHPMACWRSSFGV